MWHLLVSATLLLLCVILVGVYLIFIRTAYFQHRCLVNQGIPCAPFIPVVGSLLQVIHYTDNDLDLVFFVDMEKKYGAVHGYSLGPSYRLSLNDPHYFQDILRTNAALYHKPFLMKVTIGAVIGTENMLLSDGEQHTRHRQLVSPGFHFHHLKDMITLMTQQTENTIQQWTQLIKQQPEQQHQQPHISVQLHKELSALTLDIITGCAFGEGFAHIPNAKSIVYNSYAQLIEMLRKRFRTLIDFVPIARHWPILHKPMIDANRAALTRLVERVIAERKAGVNVSSQKGKKDLLDLLLQARAGDENSAGSSTSSSTIQLSDREVRDEAMTLVMAGHETTSSLLSWLLYHLMVDATLWQQLVEEVDSVFPDGGAPTSELLSSSHLPLIDAVIHETLRFNPPAPAIARVLTQDHVLTSSHKDKQRFPDIALPAGMQLQLQTYIIHRLPEYWGDDAHLFNPQRWLKSTLPYTHPLAFIPFSHGPRNCIGQSFALLEAKVILVLLLQHVEMEFVPGQKLDRQGQPVQRAVITLRPKHGLLVNVRLRNKKRANISSSRAKSLYE